MQDVAHAIKQAIVENQDFNMSIWNEVDVSDPSELKKVNQRGGFLSIDAYPQIKKATRVFGPMGLGFGLSDVDYHIVEDIDVSTKDKPNTKGPVMIFRCTFWYKIPGGEIMGQIPIVNSMTFEARNDAPKKLLTNCISKALSYLGFNYDVFSGRWDDDPYLDRPDIPCPAWLRENFNRLIGFEVEGEPFFNEKAKKQVNEFQINAGWTLQSVSNFVSQASARIQKAGHPLPNLLEEGDSPDGIQQEAPEASSEGEEKADSGEKEA